MHPYERIYPVPGLSVTDDAGGDAVALFAARVAAMTEEAAPPDRARARPLCLVGRGNMPNSMIHFPFAASGYGYRVTTTERPDKASTTITRADLVPRVAQRRC